MDDLNRLRWGVLVLLVALAFASAGWALARNGDFESAALSLGIELIGAVVTYALFELIIERRERREAEKKALETRKAELIAQMGSDVRDVAVPAADELRRQGWLSDGSLRGADLVYADLHGAYLSHADLKRVDFRRANLAGANLGNAHLEQANLSGVNLEGAYLCGANLEGTELLVAHLEDANLGSANLRTTILQSAHLQRADLLGASLQGANLKNANLAGTHLWFADLREAQVTAKQLDQAKSLRAATLPDGTKLSEDNWEAEFEEWRQQQEEKEND
jgi:hypothetical protein